MAIAFSGQGATFVPVTKWSLFKNGVTLPMEGNSIEVYTEKYNPQLFSMAEHHIKSKGNSEFKFE